MHYVHKQYLMLVFVWVVLIIDLFKYANSATGRSISFISFNLDFFYLSFPLLLSLALCVEVPSSCS